MKPLQPFCETATGWILTPLFIMHRQFSKGGQGVKGNRGEAGVIAVQQLQTAQSEL